MSRIVHPSLQACSCADQPALCLHYGRLPAQACRSAPEDLCQPQARTPGGVQALAGDQLQSLQAMLDELAEVLKVPGNGGTAELQARVAKARAVRYDGADPK